LKNTVYLLGIEIGSICCKIKKLKFTDFFFKSSLKGCYVTAEDVGTKDEDMSAVFSKTRFTTCIPSEVGLLEILSENLIKY
jgi:hypothetical protein